MTTDVDVQYFSHLNGLTLGNNWGDLIRLLDKALVTGIDFTQITAASIDEQGDVHITLYSDHKAMLFQIVELSGFMPVSLNQKYRIKGVPNTTQLILKPALNITERSITTIGAGKLASLGYEIIFRDTGDVKRVYRAKNPTAQHPFIRVDESLTSPDGTTGVYTSTYAKSAMVGLIENMTHIDDYSDTLKLQLPLDTTDFGKNWKITGTGNSVVRGWSKWYWARYHPSTTNPGAANNANEASSPQDGYRAFTICGDSDAFYLLNNYVATKDAWKVVHGAGLFNNCLPNDVIPNWFLFSRFSLDNASSVTSLYSNLVKGITPLMNNAVPASFYTPKYDTLQRVTHSIESNAITPDFNSGLSALYSASNVPALEIPIVNSDKYLLGTLKHIYYSGGLASAVGINTKPTITGRAMYVHDRAHTGASALDQAGGFYFYLGELE